MEYWKQEYLAHHGILGMKWGRRNGPPYPLSANRHSESEKRAGWKKSLGGERNEGLYNRNKKSKNNKKLASKIGNLNGRTLVSERGSTVAAKLGASALLSLITTSSMANVVADADNYAASLGSLFLINMGINSGLIFGINAIVENNYKNDKKNNVKNNNSFNELEKIKKRHSETQDQAAVNPGYLSSTKRQMNCTMCTTAYEMRRRGYDVEANGTDLGRTTRDAATWFNISEDNIYDFDNYSDFESKIMTMPDGSRGNICAQVGPFMSNHSMVWEKKGSRVIIRDCQTNTTYDSLRSSIINEDGKMFEFFRTDNATINEALIMDAIRKAG